MQRKETEVKIFLLIYQSKLVPNTLMMKMFCDFFLRSFIQFLHMCLLLLILFFCRY